MYTYWKKEAGKPKLTWKDGIRLAQGKGYNKDWMDCNLWGNSFIFELRISVDNNNIL